MEEKETAAESLTGGKFELNQSLEKITGGSMQQQGNQWVPAIIAGIAGLVLGGGTLRGAGFGPLAYPAPGFAPFVPAGGGGCCYATNNELMLVKEIAAKDAVIANKSSNEFTLLTDQKLTKEICDLKAKMAHLEAKENADVAFLAKEDHCIKEWVGGHFVKGKLVLPSTPTITGYAAGCCSPAATPATEG